MAGPQRPALWPWSSYPGYCDWSKRLDWVCYDELLQAWEGEFGSSAASYREYVGEVRRALNEDLTVP